MSERPLPVDEKGKTRGPLLEEVETDKAELASVGQVSGSSMRIVTMIESRIRSLTIALSSTTLTLTARRPAQVLDREACKGSRL